MAKLVNEDELIAKRVDDYLDKSTSEYTRFLETTPNFVTYYQYDRVISTMDKGLENVESNIGSHSPNRFKKIEKFPIYEVDTMNLIQSFEDTGMKTTYEGEAVILPGTLRPYTTDMFVIDYIGKQYLFKITNVNNDTIRNKPFYRIQFELDRRMKDSGDIDLYLTGEYISIFDNIGTNYDNVITKKDFLTIDYIDKISLELIDRYKRNFYDKRMNVISLKNNIGSFHLYNRYITKFLMDHELLKIEKGFMTDIYLVDIADDMPCFFENYKKTIFYALERKNPRLPMRQFAEPYTYKFKINQFDFFGKWWYGLHYNDTENSKSMCMFPIKFTDNIRSGELYTEKPSIEDLNTDNLNIIINRQGNITYVQHESSDFTNDPEFYPEVSEGYIVENIIIDYMHNRLELTEEMLDAVNDIDFSYDMYCYSMVPLLLYVMKEYKKNLQKTLS